MGKTIKSKYTLTECVQNIMELQGKSPSLQVKEYSCYKPFLTCKTTFEQAFRVQKQAGRI